MIETISLFPFAAAVMSAALIVLATTRQGVNRRAGRWFVALNASNLAWCVAYFAHLNRGAFADLSLATPGTPDYFLLWVMAFGVGGSPAFMFLFSAESAASRRWGGKLGVALALGLLGYTVVAALSNPWHHLFMRPLADGRVAPGLLAVPHYVLTYALMGGAAVLIIRAALANRTTRGRWQALVLGGAYVVPLIASALWATRSLTGLPIPINPIPVLFPAMNAIVAFHVVHRGFGAVFPLASLASIVENTETCLAYLDRDFRFVSVNAAFLRLLERPAEHVLGKDCFELLPDGGRRSLFEAARTTGEPIGMEADSGESSVRSDGRCWRWSLVPAKDEAGDVQGFVLSVEDVTAVVRERELHRTLHDLDRRVYQGAGSERVLRDAVVEAMSALGCDSATVALNEDHEWRVLRGCERGDASWTPLSECDMPHLALAIDTESLVLVDDALTDDRLDAEAMRALGVLSCLVVPLVSECEVVGSIAFETRSAYLMFSPPQLEFVRRLASMCTVALEHGRLYDAEHHASRMIRHSVGDAHGRVRPLRGEAR